MRYDAGGGGAPNMEQECGAPHLPALLGFLPGQRCSARINANTTLALTLTLCNTNEIDVSRERRRIVAMMTYAARIELSIATLENMVKELAGTVV